MPYGTVPIATLVVADGGERPEVGRLGVRHLGGVDGGDGQVVGTDDSEAPLVGDVADDALHAVGVDVAIKWLIDNIDIKWISEWTHLTKIQFVCHVWLMMKYLSSTSRKLVWSPS